MERFEWRRRKRVGRQPRRNGLPRRRALGRRADGKKRGRSWKTGPCRFALCRLGRVAAAAAAADHTPRTLGLRGLGARLFLGRARPPDVRRHMWPGLFARSARDDDSTDLVRRVHRGAHLDHYPLRLGSIVAKARAMPGGRDAEPVWRGLKPTRTRRKTPRVANRHAARGHVCQFVTA